MVPGSGDLKRPTSLAPTVAHAGAAKLNTVSVYILQPRFSFCYTFNFYLGNTILIGSSCVNNDQRYDMLGVCNSIERMRGGMQHSHL